jgi:hypothetical protein
VALKAEATRAEKFVIWNLEMHSSPIKDVHFEPSYVMSRVIAAILNPQKLN